VETGGPSEYADALRLIRAARETEVIEQALSAAREQRAAANPGRS
jgi:hypothetical protein